MATILVVDDEPHILDLMRDWLTLHRYDVLTALNGLDALRLAEAQKPNLILLDVMMPDISGIDVCKRLRTNPRTTRIPIMLMSGRDPSGGRVEGLMAGASDYVTKPVNLEDLAERINALLNRNNKSPERTERLLEEAVHAAVAILPCDLAWLLTVSPDETQLVSRAIAASGGEHAAARFMRVLTNGEKRFAAALDEEALARGALLLQSLMFGTGEFNLPLASLPERGEALLHEACEALKLGYLTVVPLQVPAETLGVFVLGSSQALDVDTPRGQQILSAVVSQAATAADNARLVRRLFDRESQSTGERAFHQLVLDTMNEGLLLHDAEGRISFANRRLASMTGYEPDALTSKNVAELCIPEDRTRIETLVKSSGYSDSTPIEVTLRCADGKTLPVLITPTVQSVSRKEGVQEHGLAFADLSTLKVRETALVKQSDHLSALNRAAQAISSTSTLDEALVSILNEAMNTVGAKVAAVMLRAPGSDALFCQAAVGHNAEALRGQKLSVGQSIAGYVARECQPLLLDDAYLDERFRPGLFVEGMQIRSAAAVPVIVHEDAVGAIEVVSDQEGFFSLVDIPLLEGLARAAAMAIENASLFGETQRQLRELRLLLQASEAASSTLTLDTVLETVARRLLDALNVTWCIISSWERDEHHLVKLAEIAEIVWPPQRQRTISVNDYPATEQAIRSNRPLVTTIDDPAIEPPRRQALVDGGYWTALVLPIAIKGEVVGVAELYHSTRSLTFSEPDVDRSQAVISSWRNAFPVDLSWNAPDCLEALGRELLGATGGAWCTILAYQPGPSRLAVIYETGRAVWPIGRGDSRPLDDNSLRRIALVERVAVTARLDDAHLSAADRTALPRVSSGSMLVAPLVAHGESVGLVELVDIDTRRVYSDNELNLAQAIANVIGSALENGRLYAALARRAAQLEAAYNDLRDADRTTEEMIQNVSHELRTPLTSIIGYTDMLMARDLGPLTEEQQQAAKVINTQSRLLSRMVSDIVTVQDIRNEPLQRRLVSLRSLAEVAVKSMALEAAQQGIEFATEIPADLPDIYLDEERILQALENLLSNAVKYSPNGGKVLISIRDVGHSIRVDVTDPGIGIPAEEQPKIWRRFYQVDGSRTRRFSGLGLGLTIVKQVLEQHEGHATVESEPGKGSTFTITIPKIEETPTSRPEQQVADSQ